MQVAGHPFALGGDGQRGQLLARLRSSAFARITPNMPISPTQIAAMPITSPQSSAPLISHTTATAPTDATTAPSGPHRRAPA